MGLHRLKPAPSARMGMLWALGSVSQAAVVEFGSMGHLLYGRVFLHKAGVVRGAGLYSTHLDETDIALGNTHRLDHTVKEIIHKEQPKVIFLLPSSVPQVIGTDLLAAKKRLEMIDSNVKIITCPEGGFGESYQDGIKKVLLLLAEQLTELTMKTKEPTFNIIGSCSDLFRFHEDANEIQRIMEGAFGMKPVCILTSDTSVEQVKKMSGAHLNLVIRREGLEAAKYLEHRHGTPYLFERPYGIEGTSQWINRISDILGRLPKKEFVVEEKKQALRYRKAGEKAFQHFVKAHPEQATIHLGGHPDVVWGIRNYATEEFFLHPGRCFSTNPQNGESTIIYFSESERMEALRTTRNGIWMTSGELLQKFQKSLDLQIDNPDVKWRLNPFGAPLVGFRGGIHLANLWLNELIEQEERE